MNSKNQISPPEKMSYPFNRSSTIDFIKGIAIICVIVGHCIEIGGGDSWNNLQLFWDNELHIIIYTFHMPLFALISGYLFFSSVERSIQKNFTYFKFLINKAKHLLIPVVSWGFIYVLVRIACGPKFLSFDFNLFLLMIIKSWILDAWFLKSIFFFSVIVVCNRILFKDNLFVYIVCLLIMMVMPRVLDFNVHFYVYPYFIIGYYCNKYKAYARDKLLVIKLHYATCLSIIFYLALLIFYNKDCYIYTTGLSLWGTDSVVKQIIIDFYRWLIGIFGCCSVIGICILLNSKKENIIQKCVCNIGKKTLELYVVSVALNSLVCKFTYQLTDFSYLFCVVESILVLIISCLLIDLVAKYNKRLNLYLFGK